MPKSSGLVLGRRPLGAVLHSLNEPGELSQWLCHDDSTINIVEVIIIIIIIIILLPLPCPAALWYILACVPLSSCGKEVDLHELIELCVIIYSHTNYSAPVNLLVCASYYTITPLHALYGRLINFSSPCLDLSLNLVKDRLVIWLLQSGMDYFLISDFHQLSTPSNAI